MKNTLLPCKIIITSLLLLTQTPLFADIYKWSDTAGHVHYSAHPGNNNAKKVSIRRNWTTEPRIIKTAANHTKTQNLPLTAQNEAFSPANFQPETSFLKKEVLPRKICQRKIAGI